jgi:lipopolysaccharide/colanic/teichoic acid biosynthesis glycosyltransferase
MRTIATVDTVDTFAPRTDESARGGTAVPRRRRVAYRVVDITIALCAVVVVLPLMLILAVVIKLDSRGPVFFRCQRVGFGGVPLSMLKFRKMHDGARGSALTTSTDDRFTRVGVWLAKLKLDELPQFWHVLRGQMSIVGPRPEDPGFVERHGGAYQEILTVRPGILGLSQLAFANESRILDADNPLDHYLHRIMPQKVELDLMYVRHRTLFMDLKIIAWSAVAVLFRREVAVARDSATLRRRRRP